MKLNREQYLSVYSNKNLSVTANAGSGKTSVLTKKYLHLLLNDGEVDKDPSKIVAITFTKKAASEMKLKILETLNEEINLLPASKEKAELKKIRNNFKNARIQTYHSFCNELIEQFPEYTGFVSIKNDMLESDEEKFINLSYNQLILDQAKNNSIQFRFILKYINYYKLEKVIRDLATNPLILNDLEHVYFNNDKIISDSASSLFIEYANTIISYLIQHSKYLYSIEGIKRTGIAESKLFKAKNTLIRIERYLNNNDIENVIYEKEEIVLFNEALKTLSYYFKNHISEEFITYIEFIKTIFFITDGLNYSVIQILIARTIYSWAKILYLSYQEKKKDIQFVDYSDQLNFAFELLKKDYVQQTVASNIKYLLIDEFQDTNYIQFEIIKKLIAGSNAKLFIVGDQKQSIYKFRNSEVRLFNDTTDLIKKINLDLPEFENKHLSNFNFQGDESKGEIELKVSYRMNQELAFLINSISSYLFSELNGMNDKDSTKNTPIVSGNYSISERHKPYFELLLTDDKEHQPINVTEAIFGLLDSEVKLSQIGILARNNNHLIEISKQLLIQNVPFELHANRNLFKIPEIDDIINFLEIINGDESNFRIIKLLQSYFFACDDVDLINLHSHNINIIQALGQSINVKFDDIYSLINLAREISYKLNLTELIYYLLANSNWHQITSNTKINESIENSVQVLNYIISDISKLGVISLSDFLEYVKSKSSNKDSSKTDIALSNDKINLLTIHASKGLEFDCVIMYDSNSTRSNSKEYYISKEFGLSVTLTNNSNENILTPLDFLVKEENNKAEQEEFKRLLYVALTRAKQKLIISGNINKDRKGICKIRNNSFLDLICKGLELDVNNINLDNDSVQKSGQIEVYSSDFNTIETKEISTVIHFKNYSKPEKIRTFQNKNKDVIISLNSNIQDSIQLETLTATKLNYLKNDIILFKERYMLGMPESDKYQFKGIFKSNSTEEDKVLGTKKGIYIHSILENIKTFIIGRKFADKLVLKTISNIFKDEIIINKEYFIKNITEIIFSVLDSNFIQNNFEMILKSKTEVSFEMPFKEDFLNGLIDLYTTDKNGNYEIWDWKTNNIERHEIEEKALFYKPQMLFYTYLLSHFNRKQEVFKAKLFFTKFAGSTKSDSDWIYTFEFNNNDLLNFERELKTNFNLLKEEHFN